MPSQVYDEHGCFFGHEPRECGEHRTVGDYRAWCFDCGEWCYPDAPCVRCEITELRAKADLTDGTLRSNEGGGSVEA